MMNLTRLVIFLNALLNLFAGLGLLFFPHWFFENIGHFPPYNRHYLGDAGAFLLPWGVALLIVARDPRRRLTLLGVATLASVIHAVNHLVGDLALERLPLGQVVRDNLQVWIFTVPLVGAYLWLRRNQPA